MFFTRIGMLSGLDKLPLKVVFINKVENSVCYPKPDNNLLGNTTEDIK